MSLRGGQLVTVPTWGGPPADRRAERHRLRAVPSFPVPASPAVDAIGAALVLGGSLALWTAVLAAVW